MQTIYVESCGWESSQEVRVCRCMGTSFSPFISLPLSSNIIKHVQGNATRDSRDGNLLQLRALDWDTEGPFRDYHLITVYHPTEDSEFNTFANLGFVGWIASITGMSQSGLSVSEIGVSMPDASFGKERYLAPGYPFGFLIRDILQSDRSLDDSINRIVNAKRM